MWQKHFASILFMPFLCSSGNLAYNFVSLLGFCSKIRLFSENVLKHDSFSLFKKSLCEWGVISSQNMWKNSPVTEAQYKNLECFPSIQSIEK